MIMLFFDHKWFSLQRMVYLFQVWLKVNFWSDPFTKVDNRLCIRQRVCFPSLSNTSTNRYLCKDPKENIESTSADGVFSMGPFRGEYLGKSKVYAVARQPTQQTMSQQRSQSIFLNEKYLKIWSTEHYELFSQ